MGKGRSEGDIKKDTDIEDVHIYMILRSRFKLSKLLRWGTD